MTATLDSVRKLQHWTAASRHLLVGVALAASGLLSSSCAGGDSSSPSGVSDTRWEDLTADDIPRLDDFEVGEGKDTEWCQTVRELYREGGVNEVAWFDHPTDRKVRNLNELSDKARVSAPPGFQQGASAMADWHVDLAATTSYEAAKAFFQDKPQPLVDFEVVALEYCYRDA